MIIITAGSLASGFPPAVTSAPSLMPSLSMSEEIHKHEASGEREYVRITGRLPAGL